jgi:diguanylate cyclase (GGDEF)-like protein
MAAFWRIGSLRGKLIAACLLVQLAVTALTALMSSRLLQETLTQRMKVQVAQIVSLLDQIIATPMAQRDYAAVQLALDLVRADGTVTYLVLRDHRNRIVGTSGWDPSTPLPPRDGDGIDLDRPDSTLHVAMPVVVSGQTLGHLDIGLATVGLRTARSDFLRRSTWTLALALVASTLLMALIAYAITRHLTRLAEASRRVAEGDLEVRVPADTGDEIGRLGASFNSMAIALKQRMGALEHSEAQQRQLLTTVREEQARLHSLLGAMRDGILFADATGHVIYANAAFARIWSLDGVAPGLPLRDLVPGLLRQSKPGSQAPLRALLDAQADVEAVRVELHTLDGRILTQRMQPVDGVEGRSACIWFYDDITLERQTEQRAEQASRDALTGLHNRRGLFDELESALQRAASETLPLTLMFIDLDDFKLVNDFGGHRAGDEVLQAVADALSAVVRLGEVVARLGGDEFAVMCPGLDAEDAGALAVRIVNAVGAVRYAGQDQALRIGCSVGIATYPLDAVARDDLIACADTAMYQAKQDGKNGWSRYRNDPARTHANTLRVDWNARIHRALQQQGLVLHFQPVFRVADMQLSHHEALLRMVNDQDVGHLIPPGSFIGHAERSGKIAQLDRWVFQSCVERLAATHPDVRIAANLSARSLEDGAFPGFLSDLLQRHNVDPRRLHIELTETSAIGDGLAARRMIATLGALGCAIHLDDFGSGFSSYAQLKLLDVDAVKIDGSFIRDLAVDTGNRIFVEAMTRIVHSMHKQVVAEHVEDAATLDILRDLGVDMVQGFHVGRPDPLLVEGGAEPLRLVSGVALPREGGRNTSPQREPMPAS